MITNDRKQNIVSLKLRSHFGWIAQATLMAGCLPWLFAGATVHASELSADQTAVRPGGVGLVTVSGSIEMESTYGVTVMVELVPRPGTTGKLEFTRVRVTGPLTRARVMVETRSGHEGQVRVTSPVRADVDVLQPGDAWPNRGSFTAFDTDRTRSPALNGSVDDNGSFIPSTVSYGGPVSAFPVRASGNASGVWDVWLSTSAGDSSWEGLDTDLIAGTVTVRRDACKRDRDCGDKDPCTADSCHAGVCSHVQISGDCQSGKPSTTSRKRSNNNRDNRSSRGER